VTLCVKKGKKGKREEGGREGKRDKAKVGDGKLEIGNWRLEIGDWKGIRQKWVDGGLNEFKLRKK
jgi:hypothetical protein